MCKKREIAPGRARVFNLDLEAQTGGDAPGRPWFLIFPEKFRGEVFDTGGRDGGPEVGQFAAAG